MIHALPTLTRGGHEPWEGYACAMEYLSVIAGEEWSDNPECTHETLTSYTVSVNDHLDDDDRPLLVPLLCRLLGANEGRGDAKHPVSVALKAYHETHPTDRFMRGQDLINWLTRLIDTYDRAAGRTETPVITDEQWDEAVRLVTSP